jgi:hypothetical protein
MVKKDYLVQADYCVTNAAPSETLSPLGFVRTNDCAPVESAGAGNARVFLSLKVTHQCLPAQRGAGSRLKSAATDGHARSPVDGPAAGVTVPIPSGTLESCKMLRPEVVSAKRRWPFSSTVKKLPCKPSTSVESIANGSGR